MLGISAVFFYAVELAGNSVWVLNVMLECTQSSGAVWKKRWPSWAPISNKPTVSVAVKQHWTIEGTACTAISGLTVWANTPASCMGKHPNTAWINTPTPCMGKHPNTAWTNTPTRHMGKHRNTQPTHGRLEPTSVCMLTSLVPCHFAKLSPVEWL